MENVDLKGTVGGSSMGAITSVDSFEVTASEGTVESSLA